MHKIVHLDLKGAPLKLPYLEQVLISVKSWGATGILYEWEDTFPYVGELEEIGSAHSGEGIYSADEVRRIMQFSKEIGLEPIQLVQTIGHMEFVLKHPAFRGLRELPRSPAVLCPMKENSRVLVRMMVDQVLAAQPDAKYLHIGADEVWHTALCTNCSEASFHSEFKGISLFLSHVRDLAAYIKEKRPNLTILMWDDMLRNIGEAGLRSFNLGQLVQPVVWHYYPKESFTLAAGMWSAYRRSFPAVWAASAYKGANGSCAIVSPVSRYVSNNEGWLEEIRKMSPTVNFAGIILTGWSRYDHFATLCELMPVAMPSLNSCLRLLNGNQVNVVREVLPSSEWPGEGVALKIHSLSILIDNCRTLIDGDLVTTWMNPWQLRNNYTNPEQVQSIFYSAQELIDNFVKQEKALTPSLLTVTGPRSTDEFVGTYIQSYVTKLIELRNTADSRLRIDAGIHPVQ